MLSTFRISISSAIITLLTLIGAGTWAFHSLESWTWAESFYFSVATLSTVGYGDIHPTSDYSRVIAAIFILVGVGIVIAALTRIGSAYLAHQERRLTSNITRIVNHSHKQNGQRNHPKKQSRENQQKQRQP